MIILTMLAHILSCADLVSSNNRNTCHSAIDMPSSIVALITVTVFWLTKKWQFTLTIIISD